MSSLYHISIYLINRIKKKNNVIISINAGKTFDKIKQFMIKLFNKLKIGDFLGLIKIICIKIYLRHYI